MSKEKELNKKLKKIKELSNLIVLHQGEYLGVEKRQEIDNWQARMEFRLSELLDKFKQEEADIKIDCMSEVVKILNNVQ